MKPRLSPAATVVLPSFSAELEAEVVGGVAGALGPDDLEQRHHLRRVEEMQPEEALGPRPVTAAWSATESEEVLVAKKASGLTISSTSLPHLELAVEVLGDRLDHQVAVGEVGVVERCR